MNISRNSFDVNHAETEGFQNSRFFDVRYDWRTDFWDSAKFKIFGNFRKFEIFDENWKSSTSLRNFCKSKNDLISKSHQDNDQQLDENWTAVNSGYQGSSNHHPFFRLEFSQWETTTAVIRFLSAGYFLTVYFCGKMFKNCSFFLDPDLGDDLPQCPARWALGVVILLDNRVRQVSVLLYNLTLSNNSLKWYFVAEKHFSQLRIWSQKFENSRIWNLLELKIGIFSLGMKCTRENLK